MSWQYSAMGPGFWNYRRSPFEYGPFFDGRNSHNLTTSEEANYNMFVTDRIVDQVRMQSGTLPAYNPHGDFMNMLHGVMAGDYAAAQAGAMANVGPGMGPGAGMNGMPPTSPDYMDPRFRGSAMQQQPPAQEKEPPNAGEIAGRGIIGALGTGAAIGFMTGSIPGAIVGGLIGLGVGIWSAYW